MKHQGWQWMGTLSCLLIGTVGCDRVKPIQLDTSAESRALLVAGLGENAARAQGFMATGNSIHGFLDTEGKTQTFNFQCKFWFMPPHSVRLLSHATMQGNIDLGCNDDNFWMAIKPEINTYYWGRWDRTQEAGLLPVNPQVVLEAIGIVDMGDPNDWTLTEADDQFVLKRVFPDENLVKRIHLNRKDQRIERILYTDTKETPLGVADLAGHRVIAKDFSVPTITRITAFDNGERVGWITIKLKTFRLDDLSEKKFTRPPERGYEKVIEVTKDKPLF